MHQHLRFPIYVIANRAGVVVVNTKGKDCVLLFHSRELAEDQIEKINGSHRQLGTLHALAVPDVAALREGLHDFSPSVTCAVWDPTGTPAGFMHVLFEDLLLSLSG